MIRNANEPRAASGTLCSLLCTLTLTSAGCAGGLDEPAAGSPHVERSSIVAALVLEEPDPFLRGDANDDGQVNLADAQHVLNYLFQRGDAPE